MSVDEMVIHKNKIRSFQAWLNNAMSQANHKQFRLIILSGPSGSGKTTLVRQICRLERIFLYEWERLEEATMKDALIQKGCISRFKPLEMGDVSGCRGSCILVDDLCGSDFRETIKEVQSKTQSICIPVIGIVTGELSPVMLRHLEDNPNVELKCLTLNPIAPSAVLKTLSMYGINSQSSHKGDLRAAMIDAHMHQLHASALSEQSMTRDHEGNIFHLAGHILHGKGGVDICSDRNQLNRYLQYNYIHFVDTKACIPHCRCIFRVGGQAMECSQ